MKPAMRVTIVIGNLRGGGAERVCVNLANAWAAGGRRVTLLTISRRGEQPAYDVDPRVELRDVGWPGDHEITARSLAPVLRVLRADGCPNLLLQAGFIAVLRDAILA